MSAPIFTAAQILEWLEGKAWSLRQWLSTPNGKPHPRPSFEIAQKKHDLEMVEYMISRYHERTHS
jgi:hypothetical protein